MSKNAPAGNRPRSTRPDPLADCPLNAAFVAIGGKWKLTILYWLGREPLQFRQLQRRIAPVSHKVLVEQHRDLEAQDLIRRAYNVSVTAAVIFMHMVHSDTTLSLS